MLQLDLEKEMAYVGRKKYQQALEDAVRQGTEDRLDYGQAIIAKNIQIFEKKIKEYIQLQDESNASSKSPLYAYAGAVKADVLALYTLSTVVGSNSRNDSVATMALRIGQRVEKEVRWSINQKADDRYHFNIMRTARELAKAHPGYKVTKYLAKRDVADVPVWSKETRMSIGMALIDLLHNADIGFEKYKWIKGKRQTYYVRITPKGRPIAVSALGGILESDDLWPMIEEPADWVDECQGGYLSNGDYVGPFNVVRAEMKPGDMDMCDALNALNKMQKQAWTINPKVLRVFYWARRKHLALATGALPKDTIGSETVLKGHLSVLKKIRKGKFWVPHNFCWRGRFMAQPSFSFQGPDYCRGLMRFADEKPIGRNGHRWISLHMANSYGDDKISKEERHEWADNHLDLVERVATNPVANFDDWREVDAPWQFLAACIEYWEWHNDWHRSPSYLSGLPIGMDGSSNAIQHGSAFLRDAVGASWVNMTEKEDTDPPSDLYRKVSDAVNAELNLRANSGDELAKQWLDFGVTRKTVKRIVMTRGYAGSKYGTSDMLVEDILSKTTDKPFAKDREAAVYLGTLAHEKSMEILQGLAGTMEFLQSTVSDKPVLFKLPTGFVFRQDYRKKKSKKVNLTSLPNGRIQLRLNVDSPSVDTRKMKAGISANFTHACDAAHLAMVVNNFDGPLGLVHDSYSTVPGRCEDMYAEVREQFIQLHELDMLSVYQQQVAHDVALPKYGEYQIGEIRRAPYAFL